MTEAQLNAALEAVMDAHIARLTYCYRLLQNNSGTIAAAARAAGVDEQTITRAIYDQIERGNDALERMFGEVSPERHRVH